MREQHQGEKRGPGRFLVSDSEKKRGEENPHLLQDRSGENATQKKIDKKTTCAKRISWGGRRAATAVGKRKQTTMRKGDGCGSGKKAWYA